jgi:hypothetical protein
MLKIFSFGESVYEYNYKVINEREARASAGIMFLFGVVSLFYFILTQDLLYAEAFSITFILEFFIRIFINPLYAPYMIISSLIVRSQKPEWVEASPKKFAWVLGLILGLVMGYYVVFNVLTPARMIICLICLTLLYLEAVFGICLGCIIYKKLNFKLQNCPGGMCEMGWQKPKRLNSVVAVVFVSILFSGLYYSLKAYRYTPIQDKQFAKELAEDEAFLSEEDSEDKAQNSVKEDCTPPKAVVAMGHKEMWLEHHGCK